MYTQKIADLGDQIANLTLKEAAEVAAYLKNNPPSDGEGVTAKLKPILPQLSGAAVLQVV